MRGSDYRELIPEMFYLPELLLGRYCPAPDVTDVALPAWARSADEFVLLHRKVPLCYDS